MLRNYLKIAWRNLVKSPTYSLINILGLAAGMAVTITIGLWVYDEITYDDYFGNSDEIAQVFQSQTFNGTVGTGPAIPRPLEFELKNNYKDYFKYIVMCTWTNGRYLRVGDVTINKTGNYIQPEGPVMLDLKILKGELTGLKDTKSIMLSESTAEALFGNEDPMGQIVKVNNVSDVKVTAVYEDIPFNNHFNDSDYFLPWDLALQEQQWMKDSQDQWGNNSFQLFVQVAENQSVKEVSDKIAKAKYDAAGEDFHPYNPTLQLLPLKDVYLRSKFENGVQVGGRIEYVWLFGTIGLFVLILACINFMNLSTARSEKRAKEVGIRKAVGSFKSQLVNQFLSESFLVVLLSYVVAIVLVLLFIQPFNELVDKKMSFPWLSLPFWAISMLFILVTSLLSGSYPALYLSSFQPVKVLKGTFKVGKMASLPRTVLVVVQFTISVALIIGTMLVMHQINYTKNRPVGYNKEGMIQIPVMSSEFDGKYDFMRNQFLASGAVDEMSGSSSPTTNIWSNRSGFVWDGKPEGFQEDLAWTEVTTEYAKSLGLKVIMGRDFSREMSTDSNAILVNKTFCKYIGVENPVGMFLRDDDDEDPGPPLQIIGVVDDMIAQSPFEPVKQAVYVFDRYGNVSYYNLRLNPEKSAHDNLAIIEDVFKEQFPNLPFEYKFIDEEYAEKFSTEERIGNGAMVFTILAIFISCLGLFGLASFVAEQRTKEIGIRKVLGASVPTLWALLSKEFVILVGISLVIAVPLAAWFMSGWLDKYTYRANMAWWIFAAAGMGAILITLVTVSFQAIRAATMDPVKSLRSE